MQQLTPSIAMAWVTWMLCAGLQAAPDSTNQWDVTTFRGIEGLPENSIRAIWESPEHVIWIGTWGEAVWRIQEAEWTSYHEAAGLLNDCIYILEPDGSGGVWAGTSGGIAHIGGGKWTHHQFEDGRDRTVQSALRTQEGVLWVGREGYIDAYEYTNPQFTPGSGSWRAIAGPEVTSGHTVTDIIRGPEGRIWASLKEYGLLAFQDGNWELYRSDRGVPEEELRFHLDRTNRLWAVGGSALLSLEGDSWVSHAAPAPNLTCMADSLDGVYYLGAREGLWVGSDGEWEPRRLLEAGSEPEINCIESSEDGSAWIGASTGLFRLFPSNWTVPYLTNQSVMRNPVLSFFAEPGFAPVILSAGAVRRYEPDSGWTPFLPGRHQARLRFITPPADGVSWILSDDSVFSYDWNEMHEGMRIPHTSGLQPHFLLPIGDDGLLLFEDRDVYILKRDPARWEHLASLPAESKRHILTAAAGKNGDVWFGLDLGFGRIANGELTVYGHIEPLRDRKVRAILCARDGSLWFGTSVAGVVRYDGVNWDSFTTHDGLQSNYVSSLYQASDGTIWVGSRNGDISSYRDGRWIRFTREDGTLPGVIGGIGEYPAGVMWFLVQGLGLCRYEPDSNPPNTWIVSAPQDVIPKGIGVFSVSGLDAWNQTVQSDLVYSWRLTDGAGHPKSDWPPFTPSTTIATGQLPSGRYRLEVRAADRSRNADPTPASVEFRVLYPIWARPEFWIPVGGLTVFALVLIWMRRQYLIALHQSEEKYRDLVERARTVILKWDPDCRITYWNECATRTFGYGCGEAAGKRLDEFIYREDAPCPCLERMAGITQGPGTACPGECLSQVIRKDGSRLWMSWSCMPIFGRKGNLIEMQAYGLDVTGRQAAEEERDELIGELREALENVKTLSGLLPICANCKKIRDDSGYWTQIEHYVSQHSEAMFSHGMCPDCMERLYPEYVDRNSGSDAGN